jgi:hypothetical protein
MAVLGIHPASVIRGTGKLGRGARGASARVALLALVPAAGALALAGGGAAPALAAGPAPSCSAGTCTVSFTTPGTGQSFTVPAGVPSLSVALYGGAGGATAFSGQAVAGGDGALVTATLAVTPGQALGVDVGGAGAGSAGTTGAPVAGGANGGGNGFDSGGGGGATDVSAAGTRLLVAGGGGGAGQTQPGFVGICAPGPGGTPPVPTLIAGGPGGNADNPGTAGETINGDDQTAQGGFGGHPGTTSGPGVGGLGGVAGTPGLFGICPADSVAIGATGNPGSGATGGSAIEDSASIESGGAIGDAGGGGGGGGYFGGGAGGIGGSELSSSSTTAGSGGGGGGASYTAGAGVSGASVSDAGNGGQVNGGNGEAVFSYTDPVATGSPAYNATAGKTLNVPASTGLLSSTAGTTQESGLTASAASGTTAQGGSVTVNADGSFGYTAAASFAGTDSFGYTVTDASGDTVSGTAVVTVAAVSTSPAADVAVGLSCPSSLSTGQSGSCTLTVTNHGPSAASKLTAVLTLPGNVTEVSCTGGCTRTRAVLTWTDPSLASGASVSYQVTVKAAQPGRALLLGAAASRNPDPHLLNNVALAAITVKR